MIYALLFWSVLAFGVAFGLGHSKISLLWRTQLDWWAERRGAEPPRTATAWSFSAQMILSLLECPACLGFWEGLIAYHFFAQAWLVPTDLPAWTRSLSFAFFTAGSNLILAKITHMGSNDD